MAGSRFPALGVANHARIINPSNWPGQPCQDHVSSHLEWPSMPGSLISAEVANHAMGFALLLLSFCFAFAFALLLLCFCIYLALSQSRDSNQRAAGEMTAVILSSGADSRQSKIIQLQNSTPEKNVRLFNKIRKMPLSVLGQPVNSDLKKRTLLLVWRRRLLPPMRSQPL